MVDFQPTRRLASSAPQAAGLRLLHRFCTLRFALSAAVQAALRFPFSATGCFFPFTTGCCPDATGCRFGDPAGLQRAFAGPLGGRRKWQPGFAGLAAPVRRDAGPHAPSDPNLRKLA